MNKLTPEERISLIQNMPEPFRKLRHTDAVVNRLSGHFMLGHIPTIQDMLILVIESKNAHIEELTDRVMRITPSFIISDSSRAKQLAGEGV